MMLYDEIKSGRPMIDARIRTVLREFNIQSRAELRSFLAQYAKLNRQTNVSVSARDNWLCNVGPGTIKHLIKEGFKEP